MFVASVGLLMCVSGRINGHLVALKVIHMKTEEGIPFTAIREGTAQHKCIHETIFWIDMWPYIQKMPVMREHPLIYGPTVHFIYVYDSFDIWRLCDVIQLYLFWFVVFSLVVKRPETRQHCPAPRHHPHARIFHLCLWIRGEWDAESRLSIISFYLYVWVYIIRLSLSKRIWLSTWLNTPVGCTHITSG